MDYSVFSQVIVVAQDQVESLTSSGWRLLGTVTDTELLQVTKAMLIPEYLKDKISQGYCNGTYGPFIELRETALANVTKYIMGLAENEHIQKLQEDSLYHQEKTKEAEARLAAYRKDHDDKMAGYLERDKAFAGLEASLLKTQSELTLTLADASAQRVEVRIHKSSLSAFEKALGTMAYKEILTNGTTTMPVVKLEDPPEEPGSTPRGDRFDRVTSDL